MNEKIKPEHLERAAYVYVRQSSMQQVRDHLESQRRQYALAERAKDLGFTKVVVIDEDLGRSGGAHQERPGFARLLAAVCDGTVGAVCALDASRLARNNRDWHHLIDLCALTDTLVLDHDAIYDPKQRDDRLLLGFKGAVSAYEIDILRTRARECRQELIERGEFIWEVPVGYVRRDDNRLEMTPDRQIQEAVRSVFSRFRELGSARQVLVWYRQEGIDLPVAKPRTCGRETLWRPAVYGRILRMLDNPTYAGAYAYGRRHSKTVIKDGHAKRLKQQRRPLGEWEVLNPNHHPGYIGWNEYLRNQKTLEANSVVRGAAGSNAPKAGQALLGGLLRCGRCGRMLLVTYGSAKHGCVARYYCRSGDMAHASERCVSVGALRVDDAVSAKVLEALQPLGVQASIEAAEQLTRRDDGKRRIFELSLEKARYEADRARRQYDAVEPENRLVAAELEARWNDALRQVRELESRLQSPELADLPLTDEERQRLADVGRDVRSLWNHPDAPASLKKRILRTVLEEIVIDITPELAQTQLRLHWAGGVHTELRVRKNRTGQHRHCTDREVVDLVRELAKVCKDYEIASTLNRLGYRTGAANTWTETRVRSLRQYNTIPACDPDSRATWVTLKAAAEALEVDPSVIRRLIREGALPARQIVRYSPWIIERKDLDLPAVRHAAKAGGSGRRVPRGSPGQLELPLE